MATRSLKSLFLLCTDTDLASAQRWTQVAPLEHLLAAAAVGDRGPVRRSQRACLADPRFDVAALAGRPAAVAVQVQELELQRGANT